MSHVSTSLPYLVPDMPSAEDLLPFLQEIDHNRWYSNFGPLALRLNEQIGRVHFGSESVHTLLCSSGTAALELGLMCLGLPPGARVLVPGFTFPASANAIQNCGFEPVFCDVDEASWVLTPEIAREALEQFAIDAVMPVAALGRPLPVSQWDRFVEDTGVPVLIDAAPALGTQMVGRRLLVAYSMHATKTFGIGEGGVLACSDASVIEQARCLCNFGMDAKGTVVLPGTNAKLSEYHAAVGLAQIQRWPSVQLRRARIEMAYSLQMQLHRDIWDTQSFDDLAPAKASLVALPSRNMRSTMPVRLKPAFGVSSAEAQQQLAALGIGTRLWYNPGLHRHPNWADCRQIPRTGEAGLTTVDSLNQFVLGLPFHNRLHPEEIAKIVNCLWQIVENREISASLI